MTGNYNPNLNLAAIQKLKIHISNNTNSLIDYETIDFFISAIDAGHNFIKSKMSENGLSGFLEYLFLKEQKYLPTETKMQVARVDGAVLGALDFLETYCKDNGL